MNNNSTLEIIKCRCGNTFAACVDGSQDDEWKEDRAEYKRLGFKIEFIDRKNLDFGRCDCPKTEKDILAKSQLNLF